ncbi:hypothetical protein GRF29_19g1513809 [Pseudopithomyces chartarum]|uniref:Uncharacterized protein n=1 Tax=Pseudopithomyces chartarum TaxID=1892770 RepID=A0AAN6RKD0_9PLEO|nr:hypothetical protein GRF29_19g1513809 [Pseudopithomyces chartarum]
MASPNSYFIPGYGISRTVIQNEIHYYCGPKAIVRPYTLQVWKETVMISFEYGTDCCPGTRWVLGNHIWPTINTGIVHILQSSDIGLFSQAQIEDLKMSSQEYEEKQSRIAGEARVFVNKPVVIQQKYRRSA